MRFFLIITIFFTLILSLHAQNSEKYTLQIKRCIDPIKMDGILDERSWALADVATDFFRVLPIDTGYAETQTEVRMTYDDKNIYMGIKCIDPIPGENIIASLRRDFSFPLNDNFLVFIDPFQDKTNGFSFGSSAAGAQWDGLQADGGDVLLDWDNKWESHLSKAEGVHYHEFAIPFKTIRYKDGIDRWGINFSRLDNKRNEKSAWAPVPRQFPTSSLAFAGSLIWDAPPPPAGRNISLIPYLTGGLSKDHDRAEDTQGNFDVGMDAKIGITSSLNLDLTLNPDFSQVEVDQQVTNLSRFELFFPEKRQFFLENNDLFANFGNRNTRPFFSRRIGLDRPIIGGARLSGKLSKDWRIGFMDMVTDRSEETASPAYNYMVAAVQKQVLKRSNLAFIYAGRDGINTQPADTLGNNWNRIAGVDFNYFSDDNLWACKFFLHGSLSPDKKDIAHAVEVGYRGQNWELEWEHEYIGKDYVADVGFVPRTGYTQLNPDIGYAWFPESEIINRHGLVTRQHFIFTDGWGFTDYELNFEYELLLLNTMSFSLGFDENYIKLTRPFDPTNSGKDILPAGSEHNFRSISASMNSDRRKLLTYNIEGSYGTFFNANRTNIQTSIGYRFQPYGSISVDMDYNRLTFENETNNTDFFLIGPKFDITFTNTIFFTTWIQYNKQIDNVNINSRFQWRYAPASDLFIVYTDNYYSDFRVKNRALVLKLNYWMNL